ncbi:hypothetical protein HUT16_31225 [Kitasatospora sp. NA04385]|uniref:hypothetical protein n=1 Tax=Kitasatospora sp. NA04385 TaxID=2742135 RepID=UPI0015921617|nr:hypothetical protein [Kitasatospora sp. NA04385]QKW22957.1 hypothetical protein HUT16_31225 [Kitasatospora sp. NA04385]
MGEFRIDADREMLEFFSAVADVIQGFGVSRAEAVARVNRAWGGRKIEPYPDLMCHEEPEYWAYGMYYRNPEKPCATFPYWDLDADTGGWTVNPPPPAGDPAWTLPSER